MRGVAPGGVEGPKPLQVAVIQRTRNRRIININALIKKLRSSFAAAAAAPPPRHGFSPESDLVRSAVIEQVCAHPYVCTDSHAREACNSPSRPAYNQTHDWALHWAM